VRITPSKQHRPATPFRPRPQATDHTFLFADDYRDRFRCWGESGMGSTSFLGGLACLVLLASGAEAFRVFPSSRPPPPRRSGPWMMMMTEGEGGLPESGAYDTALLPSFKVQ
jgi:hypothetical protein